MAVLPHATRPSRNSPTRVTSETKSTPGFGQRQVFSSFNRRSGFRCSPRSGAVATAVISPLMSSSVQPQQGMPCSLRRLNAVASSLSLPTPQTTRLGCDLPGVKPKAFTAAIAA